MWAWKVDGNDFRSREEELKEAFDALLPLQTQEVEKFVSRANSTWPSVLVGPKGSGKTFLLAAKSFTLRRTQIRKKEQGRHIYPADTLFERIQGGVALKDAVEERPNNWVRASNWREAWVIALEATAFEAAGLRKTLEQDAKDQLESIFPPLYASNDRGVATTRRKHSASYYLEQVVHHMNDDTMRRDLLRTKQQIIEPALREFAEPILIFLDAPDEAIDQGSNDEPEVDLHRWLELQLGLLLSVRQIQEIKPNLTVFTTLRSEIYHLADRTPLFQQCKGHCLLLAYSPQQLEDIFRRNCEADHANWSSFSSSDPIERFLGYSTTQQSCVVDSKGFPSMIRPFDNILRHTFFRPRDLMEIGQKLSALMNRDEKSVRAKVNDTAEDLLEYLCEQAYPPWEDRYLQVLLLITSNVFSRRSLELAKERFAADNANSSLEYCPFNYLYVHGLLGTIDNVSQRQHFVVDPTARHELAGEVPASEWYFLHPALNGVMAKQHGRDYRKNHLAACGHGCTVPPLTVLEFVRIASGGMRVVYDGQSVFDDAASIPKALFATIALACQEKGGGPVGLHELKAVHARLLASKWFSTSIEAHIVSAAQDGKTDHTKRINASFRKLGVSKAIRRAGVLLHFEVCELSSIGVNPVP